MKKIAIPVINGVLSSHFGHSKYFYVYEIENNKIKSESMLNPPEHVPGSYPSFLVTQGVTDVILGGAGQRVVQIFESNGISTHLGAPVKAAKELAQDLLDGKLFISDNSCDSDEHEHGDHDHHHHNTGQGHRHHK